MRYALLSDIHGNLTALEAVIDRLKSEGPIDGVWCTGDVVGYGPDPNECVEYLRGFDLCCVAGNHDWGSVGLLNLATFNAEARTACKWTMGQLTDENRSFLASLPQVVSHGDYTLVHGSPKDPVWEYILSASQAKRAFSLIQTSHFFAGHTHVPALHIYFPDTDDCVAGRLGDGETIELGDSRRRVMVNPGSVGQPRDGDPRASCALLDGEASTLIHFRVPYDVEAVQQRMKRHRLPHVLGERLSYGW